MTMPDIVQISCAGDCVDTVYSDWQAVKDGFTRQFPCFSLEEIEAMQARPDEHGIIEAGRIRNVKHGALYVGIDGRFYRVWDDWDNGTTQGRLLAEGELETAGQAYFIWLHEIHGPECQEAPNRAYIADELTQERYMPDDTSWSNYQGGKSFQTLAEAEAEIRKAFRVFGRNPYKSYNPAVYREIYVRER